MAVSSPLGLEACNFVRRARGTAFIMSRTQLQHVLGALAMGSRRGENGLSRASGHGAARCCRGYRGLGWYTGQGAERRCRDERGRGNWDTRPGAAASAGCRRVAWVVGVGVAGVGEGSAQGVSERVGASGERARS